MKAIFDNEGTRVHGYVLGTGFGGKSARGFWKNVFDKHLSRTGVFLYPREQHFVDRRARGRSRHEGSACGHSMAEINVRHKRRNVKYHCFPVSRIVSFAHRIRINSVHADIYFGMHVRCGWNHSTTDVLEKWSKKHLCRC